jgi:hypothetical protein
MKRLLRWLMGVEPARNQEVTTPPRYVSPRELASDAEAMRHLLIEAYEDEDQPGTYRVDLSQDLLDDDPMIAIFVGPHARMRAFAYADQLRRVGGDFVLCGGK